jgi:hypothetical protein
MQEKVTAEKRLKRAGATPLFWLPAAQKVLGVAPALRHKNPCRPFFHGAESQQSFMHALLNSACRKGGTTWQF